MTVGKVLMVLCDAEQPAGLERSLVEVAEPLRQSGWQPGAAVVPRSTAQGQVAHVLAHAMPAALHDEPSILELSEQHDVVHVHAQDALHWPWQLVAKLRRRGRATLVTVHLPSYPPVGPWSPGRVRVGASLAGLGAALRLGGVAAYAPSRASAKVATRRYGRLLQVGVLPNTVADPGVASWPPGPLRLVFAGRLAPHKQPEVAIAAVLLARAVGCPVTLDVLGAGPLFDSLVALTAASPHGDAIRFHGWVGDCGPFLTAAHALVLPSADEGGPMVLLEAAARGRGAITRVGVQDSGPWQPAVRSIPREGTASQLASLLVDLSQDLDQLRTMGLAARTAFVGFHAPLLAARRWIAAYDHALTR